MFRSLAIWIGILLVFYGSYALLESVFNEVVDISYSSFVQEIKAGNVASIKANSESADVILTNGTKCHVKLPTRDVLHRDMGDELTELMEAGLLHYDVSEERISVWTVITPIISIGMLLFIFLMFMSNSGARGAQTFGRSRAKLLNPNYHEVTFDDVAGAKEEKEELAELVDFLKNPTKFSELGARIPKGVLLVGSPGTGKTLLARAVAGEAKVPFFTISGSDFVEMYVGVGASRVRDLFEQAKRAKPCIIFIDEIDAVGRKRGAGMGGGHDEREQTLNQLLVEMDGFGKNEGIIIIAATNRPDILDPALLRPGRFDRRVVVDIPDMTAREEILGIYASKKPMSKDVDIKLLAKKTSGCSGAELENIMNEAAIFAARRGKKEIDNQDISDANIKVLMGPEKKSRVIKDEEKRITAYHEAGHALVARYTSDKDKISHISIIPRGMSGGHTMYHSDDDNSHTTRGDLLSRISWALGGRAAESIVLDDITTGASEDIKYATKLAHEMVARFGMSEKIGLVCYDTNEEVFLGRDLGVAKTYSESVAGEIDSEVRAIIEKQYNTAVNILTEHKAELDAVSKALLEKETIDGAEFNKIIESV
ncbi:MAG: ATP-dependent zinc metalloprotease FtsH [Eubacteriales bacterium]|nr:ATP-dependent zinc metalloprotease FtsH [Eubacteriales bacterium]